MHSEGSPFNGDCFIESEVKGLVAAHGVRAIVETGTYHGMTTKFFCDIIAEVHTVDVNRAYLDVAARNLIGADRGGACHLTLHCGSSPKVLRTIGPSIPKPTLFFLDAHWNDYWPVLDELGVIGLHFAGTRPIVVIHDFQVPGADFGFDAYKGQALNYDYIKSALPAIYPAGWDFHYNAQAAGARRGVVYITPKVNV